MGLGSISAAGWVAHVAFLALLLLGLLYDELNWKLAAALIALWAVGYFALPRLAASGAFLVTPYVALLDVALVMLVFKRDIRLR